MKNKFFSFIVFFIFTLNTAIAYSEDFKFEASEILFLENGNIVKAINGAKATTKENTIINSDEFYYDKIKKILIATGQVEVIDELNGITINAKKVFYYKDKEIIITEGDTTALVYEKYLVNSKNVNLDRFKMEMKSDHKTDVTDGLGNSFFLDNFKYYISKKLLKGKKVQLINVEKDEFFFENAMINLKTNEIAGKDINVNFNSNLLGNSDNEPRLKGNIAHSNIEKTEVSKGVFTTCKKRDGCPPWVMSAKKINHDKSKKTIYYKDAWLKIYDIPVLYFPKFFHPDPTVKRQSGFLIPKFSDSNNLGAALDLPYYHVISDNKDLTFRPRLYSEKKYLLQTEYRSVTKNSNHIFDFSLNKGHKTKITNDNDNTRTHFFSKSNINLGLSAFDFSSLNVDIQTTSNDNYLKIYKLKSPIIESETSLKSSLSLEANRSDLDIEASIDAYEDLSKPKSDRYEFVLPNIGITKILNPNNNSNGEMSLSADGYHRYFDTNAEETILINDLLFESNSIVRNNGIKNKYSILLKNVNSSSNDSYNFKEGETNELFNTFLMETSYPLRKENTKSNSFLTPKLSLRFSPTHTKNMKNKDRRLDINNIFSLDRIGVNNAIEGGESITIGGEYKKTDKNNNEFLEFNLATIFRNKENKDLPINSNLGKKQSDVVGNLNLSPNEYLDFNYDFSLDNSLDAVNLHLIEASLNVNNFVTTFEFLEENNLIGNESYIGNKTAYNFNKNNSLSFSSRKNKKTNLTEFYNLIYEYKNDCLVAGLEYKKEYYSLSNDLKPEEQIFFSITVMPFGKTNSPNINK
jgi:LPS-assembly protein